MRLRRLKEEEEEIKNDGEWYGWQQPRKKKLKLETFWSDEGEEGNSHKEKERKQVVKRQTMSHDLACLGMISTMESTLFNINI